MLFGLTAVSQLLEFVRDAVIAAVYGVGAALDAYLVAQSVMNLVLGLVAGAMAKAVLPPVARAVDASMPEIGLRTARVAVSVTVLVLLVGSLLMALAAPLVVAVLAPGFGAATAALTVELTRVVLVATVLVAATNVLAAIAQAHGRFFASGFRGVPFNLVMIAAALLLAPALGIEALAIGFVLGSGARLLVQLPTMRAIGLTPRPSLAVRDAGFREAVALVPALLISSAVGNVNTLVDRAVGSGQVEGTISALNFGWRLVALVDTLLVVAVASAFYPAFSAAAGRQEELRRLLGGSRWG